MTAAQRLTRTLKLRQGEGRTLAVMGGFLLLSSANTVVVSAAKNGLFLSVYPGELIPHAVIAAAFLTALVAIVFTGYVAGTARRKLARGLTAGLVASVFACRALFALDARWAFLVYLWLSAVQVLVLTHAWDYAGDLLTGRQAKRLLPLIGVGASIGSIMGGAGVAPAALGLGTANLLWISIALLLVPLPLLWAIPEPAREAEEGDDQKGVTKAFIQSATRGLRSVGSNELLRLLAIGLVALTVTGTLIDLQLKFLLQQTYARDRITAIYGLLSATVGIGTLVLQLWASRVLFPKFGVSFAAILHGTVLSLAAGGAAVFGGLAMFATAQAVDDILQFSLQKPVEQVSLLPFPNRIKSVALTTLGGVLRPLSEASAGGIVLGLGSRSELLPWTTVGAAVFAAFTYTRHRRMYLTALDSAVARHVVDFSDPQHMPLVVDAGAVKTIDKALGDANSNVVVFAASLLEQLPPEDALPRVLKLIGHPVPEVRSEAARVVRRMDAPLDFASGMAMAGQLAVETNPLVIASLLDTIGTVGGVDPETLVGFLSHQDPEVRTAAIVALGRLEWEATDERLRVLLASDDSRERVIGAGAVGRLGAAHLIDALAPVLSDVQARAAALEALAALGPPAVPLLTELLDRGDLPLPLRRSVVSALAGVEGADAHDALLKLVENPELGPAALTSLGRMRGAGSVAALDPSRFQLVLHEEIQRGLRYAAVSVAIRRGASGPRESFVAGELQGLHARSVERVLRILALSYDPSRLSAISTALRSTSPSQRSNALELLEGTMSRTTAMAVMPFLEAVADGLPPPRVSDLLDNPEATGQGTAEVLLDDADWWPRALALHVLGRDDEVTIPGRPTDRTPAEGPMLPLIEKVMILKGSEFFRNFPGTDLAGIASLAEVMHVDPGEVVFEQGEEGDAFYVVVEGSIKISRGSTQLATLGPREGFGEMAILDRDTRSATATAAEETTLLKLGRDSFDRAVEQNPVVARGIYRVLTERLRNTLAQVEAG